MGYGKVIEMESEVKRMLNFSLPREPIQARSQHESSTVAARLGRANEAHAHWAIAAV